MGSRLLPKRLPNLRAPLATPRRTPFSRQKKTAILSWSPTFMVRRTMASAWSVGMALSARGHGGRTSARRRAGRGRLEEIPIILGRDLDVGQDLPAAAQ